MTNSNGGRPLCSLDGRPSVRNRRRSAPKRAILNAFLTAVLHGVFSPDGRFLREIGEGMTPRLSADAESDMSLRQSSRTRFRSSRRGVTPGRSKVGVAIQRASAATDPRQQARPVGNKRKRSGVASRFWRRRQARAQGPGPLSGDRRVRAERKSHRRQREFLPPVSAASRPKSKASITASSSTRTTAKSPDYKAFWAKLGRGEFDAGEYKRIGKDGKEVWIRASYNPVVSTSRESAQGRRDRLRRHRRQIAGRRERRQSSTRFRARRRSSNSPPTGRSSRRTRIPEVVLAIRSRNSKASIIACSSTRPTRSRPNTRSSGAN